MLWRKEKSSTVTLSRSSLIKINFGPYMVLLFSGFLLPADLVQVQTRFLSAATVCLRSIESSGQTTFFRFGKENNLSSVLVVAITNREFFLESGLAGEGGEAIILPFAIIS